MKPAQPARRSTAPSRQTKRATFPRGPTDVGASSNRISALAKAKNKTNKNIVERPDAELMQFSAQKNNAAHQATAVSNSFSPSRYPAPARRKTEAGRVTESESPVDNDRTLLFKSIANSNGNTFIHASSNGYSGGWVIRERCLQLLIRQLPFDITYRPPPGE